MKRPKNIILNIVIGSMFMASTSFSFAQSNVSQKLLCGDTRFETAIKVSQEGWTSCDKAILVNGGALADALSVTPLANAYDCPILLSNKEYIPEATLDEIQRLGVKEVTLIGGNAVLSSEVADNLERCGREVSIISGETRYDTSLKIANKLAEVKKVRGTTRYV